MNPCAWLQPAYALALAARRFYFRRLLPPPRPLPARVISVGNITAGGTGKTTVTRHLAAHYRRRGQRVAVIGHGVGGRRRLEVVSDGSGPRVDLRAAGDEALLLAHGLPGVPVIVGRFRRRAARLARSRFGAETIILDDAFHDRRLPRDLDIVVFNCRVGLGNGRLLPAGPLREPLSALARADVFWLNHAGALEPAQLESFRRKLLQYNAGARVITSVYRYRVLVDLAGHRRPTTLLAGRPVFVFAGIGDPDGFVAQLRRLGARVVGARFFPDHHRYRARELRALDCTGADFIVTTAKDRVRLPAVDWPLPLLYPEIELVTEGADIDADYPGG